MANSKAETPVHIVPMSGITMCGDCWELHFEGTLYPPAVGKHSLLVCPYYPKGQQDCLVSESLSIYSLNPQASYKA